MRNRKSVLLALLPVFMAAVIAGVFPLAVLADTGEVHPEVASRTQEEIKTFIKNHPAPVVSNTYSETPSAAAPYSAGKLSEETETYAYNSLNQIRYIAGLEADVERDETYSQKAQAGALLNAANRKLSHSPDKPAGMDDELYALGKSGAGSSNIASGSSSLVYAVKDMWMEDSDSSNIDCLGHRRWLLNPRMKKTGFGAVGGYSAVYAFDNSRSSSSKGVVWPAQNMPVEYFGRNIAWSVSFGKSVDISAVNVTLEKSDGTVWNFSQNGTAEGDYFNVNNDGYGQTGCVIFLPAGLSYEAGDHFDVTITGVYDTPFKYSVDFFGICNGSHQYSIRKTTDPTCTSQGVIQKMCDNCASVKNEYVPALGHDYAVLSSQGGLLTMKCSRCQVENTGSYPVSFYVFWNDSTQGQTYYYSPPKGIKAGSKINTRIYNIQYSAECDTHFADCVFECFD